MSDANEPNSSAKLRVWFPLLLVVLQFALMYAVVRLGSTLVQNAIGMAGVPILTLLIIVVWWMRSRSVPFLERLGGVILFAIAQGFIVLTHPRYGEFMLAYSVPVMTTALVVTLAMSARASTTTRRILCAGAALLCVGAFAALRVDTVGGGLIPIVQPRWSPTAQERAEALGTVDANRTAALPDAVGPHDWPGFRGPNRDNVVHGVTFCTDWSATPPNVRWRHPVGPGLSSFAVAGNYAFTHEQRGEDEVVTCYDVRDGEPVWTNRAEARFEDSMGLGPRATPAYDRGKLFVIGATGILQCLDAATGETLWKHHLGGEDDVPLYGFASSPLVVGLTVLAYNCGAGEKALMAFDIASGEEVWRAAEGTLAYSSPHFTNALGEPQILLMNNTGIQSFVPETGALLWAHDWPMKQYPRCVQPLFLSGDTIALGTTADTGTRVIQVSRENGAWKASERWTTRKFRPYFNDCVAHEGYIYGYDGNRLNCVDGATGERVWQGERYSGQVMLIADMEMLLVMSEDGEVILLKASPEAPEEVARFAALDGKTWNHPVIANGMLLLRNAAEAACIELPDMTLSL